MTTEGTLCFILRDNEVLLLKKPAGLFGQGKWNAPGGKILPGEEPQACAIREVREETQLNVERLERASLVHFYKDNLRDSPEWTVHVFVSRDFAGTPSDGREGVVKWFDMDSLPFDEMWEDDLFWVRRMLGGERFEAWFYYSGDFEKLVDYRIEKISTTSLAT